MQANAAEALTDLPELAAVAGSALLAALGRSIFPAELNADFYQACAETAPVLVVALCVLTVVRPPRRRQSTPPVGALPIRIALLIKRWLMAVYPALGVGALIVSEAATLRVLAHAHATPADASLITQTVLFGLAAVVVVALRHTLLQSAPGDESGR